MKQWRPSEIELVK